MNLFYQPQLPEGLSHLDAEESRHCVKVLRRKNGDTIKITDGKGTIYDAVISDANQNRCSFVVTNQSPASSKSFSIHIAIAPTKNQDRMEWFVEKAVELGIDAITFLQTDHSEKVYLKHDRLVKVAISAMKQSLKATLPRIHPLTLFTDFLNSSNEDQQFIAFVDESNPLHLHRIAMPDTDTVVLIGPEGDFSAGELSDALSRGFQKVSLGKSRLRTETAGLAACHILNLVNS